MKKDNARRLDSGEEMTGRIQRRKREKKEEKLRMDRRLQRRRARVRYVHVVLHVTSLPTPTDPLSKPVHCSQLRLFHERDTRICRKPRYQLATSYARARHDDVGDDPCGRLENQTRWGDPSETRRRVPFHLTIARRHSILICHWIFNQNRITTRSSRALSGSQPKRTRSSGED